MGTAIDTPLRATRCGCSTHPPACLARPSTLSPQRGLGRNHHGCSRFDRREHAPSPVSQHRQAPAQVSQHRFPRISGELFYLDWVPDFGG